MALLPDYAAERLAAALEFPKDGLVRRKFAFAKLNLNVWFSCRELADLCGRSYCLRDDRDPSARSVDIHVLDSERPGWDAPLVWPANAGFSSRQFDRVLTESGYRGFYHHDIPSWQFFDSAKDVGVITLLTGLGIPPWETSSPLRLFLHWATASASLRLTHAATLGQGGIGAMIAGASGSGKSGTTLAGLMHGLDSVGDDYVLLERTEKLVAHSVFSTLKQDGPGLERVGLTMADVGADKLNWHGKAEFNASALTGKGLADQMEIRAILIPEISNRSRSEILKTHSRDAALSLAPSAVFQLPGDTTSGFRFFADIIRRLPAYRVRLSNNPKEIADTIGAFLSSLSRGDLNDH